MAFTRQEVLKRLRKRIEEGVPIIGGGAGNGISAKCQEAGGVDLLIIYNSGRFRMNGRGSLAGCMPYGDANGIVMEMAGEGAPDQCGELQAEEQAAAPGSSNIELAPGISPSIGPNSATGEEPGTAL